MSGLQQQLSELQSLFKAQGGSKEKVQQRLSKLKLELVKSGLYFAPPEASTDDLVATRSILEIGLLNSLRSHNDEAYKSYRASLQPFYSQSSLPPSPHRPIVLGLHLLFHLANGNLTEFHTFLETLSEEELSDDFVRLPVDLERWLMEGSYNKVYRAKDRMAQEEFVYLLDKLMRTVRNQIAATIEASYPSLKQQDVGPMLFFKPNETAALVDFAKQRNWQLHPSTNEFTFPSPGEQKDAFSQATGAVSGNNLASAVSRDELNKGVVRGVPMRTLVAPALRLASQLEAII